MTDTFDLRNDLAEVPREDDNAYFTLNLKLLAEVRTLRAAADLDEELLAQKEAELKAATYTVEMMSVPQRRKDDLYAESIDKFPAKMSFIPNHVDEKTQFQRGTWLRIALVSAGVKRLISPSGAVQEDPDSIFPTIEYLHDEVEYVFAVLETKSNELNAKEDAQDDLHKDADF